MELELGVVPLCKSIGRQDLLRVKGVNTGSFHIAIAPANFGESLDTAAVP